MDAEEEEFKRLADELKDWLRKERATKGIETVDRMVQIYEAFVTRMHNAEMVYANSDMKQDTDNTVLHRSIDKRY